MMTRTLSDGEIAKREAIRAIKAGNPSISWRELARLHGTSTRVVSDALNRGIDEARSLRANLASKRWPSLMFPATPAVPITPRAYQVDAASRSADANSLLVLPTGLGKTLIALLHVKAILEGLARNGKAGIAVFMAPTKALLVQHRDMFQEHLGLADIGLAIVDGETAPADRTAFYASVAIGMTVLFMTPQTVLNDLVQGRISRAAIVDVVVDEAHHATAGDPYHLVHKDLVDHGCSPRLLALTASPGETEARIVEVCTNLGIDPANAIIKTGDDPDVKPYTFRLDVKRYAVDLTPEYVEIRGLLVDVLKEPCAWLASSAGLAEVTAIGSDGILMPSKTTFTAMLERYLPSKPKHRKSNAARIDASDNDEDTDTGTDDIAADADAEARVAELDAGAEATAGQQASRWEVVSKLAACVKARHAIELVETQGLAALLAYHEKLVAMQQAKPTRATLAILQHPRYVIAIKKATQLVKSSSPAACHPKLHALADVLAAFFARCPSSRCIVFTLYRASIPMLVSHLVACKTGAALKTRRFVGQGDASPQDKGMSRDEQQDVLRRFKAGEFNVLVATKAAEEGIDVADCELVVFYEATASVIQFIQRQGRTGRQRDGEVAILLASGTTDQSHAAMLDTKLARLPGVYYNVQRLRVKLPGSIAASNRNMLGSKPIQGTAIDPSSTKCSVRVRSSCMFAAEIAAGFRTAGMAVSMDSRIAGDISLLGGIGVRVITMADAECWDDETTREELPGVARPVLAVWQDGALNVEAMERTIQELSARLRAAAMEVFAFTTPRKLGMIFAKSTSPMSSSS